jgi:hypothetical protein
MLDELFTYRHCLGFHTFRELAHSAPLLIRQLKLSGELEHMKWARITIELGRKR